MISKRIYDVDSLNHKLFPPDSLDFEACTEFFFYEINQYIEDENWHKVNHLVLLIVMNVTDKPDYLDDLLKISKKIERTNISLEHKINIQKSFFFLYTHLGDNTNALHSALYILNLVFKTKDINAILNYGREVLYLKTKYNLDNSTISTKINEVRDLAFDILENEKFENIDENKLAYFLVTLLETEKNPDEFNRIAEAITKIAPNELIISSLNYYKGLFYFEQGRLKESKIYLEKTANLSLRTKFCNFCVDQHHYIGMLKLIELHYDSYSKLEQKKLLHKFENQINKISLVHDLKIDGYKSLINCYGKKNPKRASYFKDLLINTLTEQIAINNKTIKVSFHQVGEIEQQQKAITNLNDDNSKLQSQKKLYVTILFFLFVISLLGILFVRYRLKKQSQLDNLNTTLVHKNEEISNKNDVLENFAFTIAHDFREPLRSLGLLSEMLYHKELSTKQKDEILDMINGSLSHLKKLIADFLVFSKSSTPSPSESFNDLNMVLELAQINLKHKITSKDAQISLDITLPFYLSDFNEMVSVFQNLLSNAITYCPKDRQPTIHITAYETDSFFIISITDNGHGVKSTHANEIFTPFKRFNYNKSNKGSGLGLSIVKNILNKNGSSVYFKNNVELGSTFYIQLNKSKIKYQLK